MLARPHGLDHRKTPTATAAAPTAVTPYCRDCDLRPARQRRGHAFCNECADYPCAELEGFQREKPHRAELYQNLERIAEVGADAWLTETKQRYTCPACGTLNSCYDLKCRKCGREPSCDFVDAHKDLIAVGAAPGDGPQPLTSPKQKPAPRPEGRGAGGVTRWQGARSAPQALDLDGLQVRADDQLGLGELLHVLGGHAGGDFFEHQALLGDLDDGLIGD